MKKQWRRSTLLVVLGFLTLASGRQLAMVVELEPLGAGDGGTRTEIVVRVAPEDRSALGEDVMLWAELSREGARVGRRGWALKVEDRDEPFRVEFLIPPGPHTLRVDLEGSSARSKGVWWGDVDLSSPTPTPEPEPDPETATDPVAEFVAETETETETETVTVAVADPDPDPDPDPETATTQPSPDTATAADTATATDTASATETDSDTNMVMATASATATATVTDSVTHTASATATDTASASATATATATDTATATATATDTASASATDTGTATASATDTESVSATATATAPGPSTPPCKSVGDCIPPVHLAVALDLHPESASETLWVGDMVEGFLQKVKPATGVAYLRDHHRGYQWEVSWTDFDKWMAEMATEPDDELVALVATTLQHLRSGGALLVVTDGLGPRSKQEWTEVRSAAKEAHISILVAGIWNEGFASSSRRDLSKLADATGGSVFYVQGPEQADVLIDRFVSVIDE